MTTVEKPKTSHGPPQGEAELAALFERLGVTTHPMLRLPTVAEARALVMSPNGSEALYGLLEKRERRILLAENDPLSWGWEFEPWEDADAILTGPGKAPGEPTPHILALFGENRCTKTWYAVKRALQVAKWYPKSLVVILSEKDETSISQIQSKIVWEVYFQREYQAMNGKRSPASTLAINYGQKNGFTDGKIVLENGSEIYFLSYVAEPATYEGWEFGAKQDIYEKTSAERRALGLFVPPNVGAVADESMPLAWFKMLERRVRWRGAKLIWSFTPIKGITPAMKQVTGAGTRTLRSKPSPLLPGRNVGDCPIGHMPYIRKCSYPGAMAIHFFGGFNPMGPAPGRTYHDAVAESCAGKTTEYIERIGYGFARDSIARAFPNFGPLNIVARGAIPAKGTNYFFFDPHGTRNFPMVWVRAVPTRPTSWYFYREWPDLATYGEWAVPTEREVNDQQRKGWDGDPGPAQTGLGWGVERYKQEILKQELIELPKTFNPSTGHTFPNITPEDDFELMIAPVVDQYHQRRLREAWRAGEPMHELHEEIAARFGDPRGIHNEHVSEKGGTTLYDLFETEQVDPRTGAVMAPAMELWDAPTSRRTNSEEADEGITLLNGLLGSPLDAMPGLHQPRVFVCEECRQLIWMFENYTGRSGGTGAAKDFADLAKYACLAELEAIDPERKTGRPGRGF